jgi:hypothetical protein
MLSLVVLKQKYSTRPCFPTSVVFAFTAITTGLLIFPHSLIWSDLQRQLVFNQRGEDKEETRPPSTMSAKHHPTRSTFPPHNLLPNVTLSLPSNAFFAVFSLHLLFLPFSFRVISSRASSLFVLMRSPRVHPQPSCGPSVSSCASTFLLIPKRRHEKTWNETK